MVRLCCFFHTVFWVLSVQGCFLSLSSRNSLSLLTPDIIYHQGGDEWAHTSAFYIDIDDPSIRHCLLLSNQPSTLPWSSFSPVGLIISIHHCPHHVFHMVFEAKQLFQEKKDPELCRPSCNGSSHSHFFRRTNFCLLKTLSHNLLHLWW